MAGVEITFSWQGDIEKAMREAGLRAPLAVARAIDEVGKKTATVVKRAVANQAGVPYRQVNGVIVSRQALGAGNGQFVLIARDVTLSLKRFGPRQTGKGVSAAPWRRRLVFAHTFVGPGGHVFKNTHKFNKKSGRKNAIEKLWGPAIPREMVKGQAEATFYAVTAQLLPFTLEKWLLK